jgi:broad specificity phosphatase PhoE
VTAAAHAAGPNPLSQTDVSPLPRSPGGHELSAPDPARWAPGRIVVVRHGATEWSRNRRHTGRTDLALEPDGETEARSVGERLGKLRPALVLSSPLRRALDTCLLAGFGAQVQVSDLLLEMDYGEYEGLTTAEVRQSRPGWDLFVDGCPGGESIEDVGARADAFIERLTADPGLAGKDVLVFAHGHVLRVMAARWAGLAPADARRFVLGSGSSGVLGWEHEWTTISGWNC